METNRESNDCCSQIHRNYLLKPNQVHKKKNISRVLWLAFVVTMPCLGPGMSFGYSAMVLDQLNLTISEASWFASLPSILMPVGCLLSGPLIDRLGRKTALMIVNFPSILGWLFLANQPPNLTILYVGQLLIGLSVGMASTPATIYAAECITVNFTGLRGCFTIMATIMLNFGMFLTYLLGMLLPLFVVAYIAAIISFTSLLGICLLIPESPPWLFEQGRHGDAEFSQKILRITQPILQTAKAAAESTGEKPAQQTEFFIRLRDPDVYKPIVIMTTFLFFQQFSGSFVMTSYLIQILQSLNVTSNVYMVTLAAGFINLAAMVLLSALLTKSGFRQLALLSCAGVSVSMISLSAYLYLRVDDQFWTNVVVITCILFYMAMNGLGLRPIPYAMLGEVFPIDVAGVAGSIATCSSSVFNFIAIKLFPYLQLWIGPGVFLMYGVLALCTFIFVDKCLPETKGKTIKQISDNFNKYKTKNAVARTEIII